MGLRVNFRDAVVEALGTQRGAPLRTDLTINLTAALQTLLQQEDRSRTALGERERHRGSDGAAGVGYLWGGAHAKS